MTFATPMPSLTWRLLAYGGMCKVSKPRKIVWGRTYVLFMCCAGWLQEYFWELCDKMEIGMSKLKAFFKYVGKKVYNFFWRYL